MNISFYKNILMEKINGTTPNLLENFSAHVTRTTGTPFMNYRTA